MIKPSSLRVKLNVESQLSRHKQPVQQIAFKKRQNDQFYTLDTEVRLEQKNQENQVSPTRDRNLSGSQMSNTDLQEFLFTQNQETNLDELAEQMYLTSSARSGSSKPQ